jgi:hypothetical protein
MEGTLFTRLTTTPSFANTNAFRYLLPFHAKPKSRAIDNF